MSEQTHDVAVVGCGPVGLTLAILLAQSGHRVVVLERQPEAYQLPRAVHFDHEVGRIFQSCGIGDELAAISEPAEVYEWRNGAGTTLLRFGRVGLGSSGWPESSMFNQPALEALLEARAATLPLIEVRRGASVSSLHQDDRGVTLGIADGSSVGARFAVGCDGANSTVRSLIGVDMHDLGFFYDWLIVDVVLDEPRIFDPINLQICDPLRPSTAVSGGPGRRRWEFMRLPGEPLADLATVRTAWRLLEPWDVHPHNATIERQAIYTFQARWAEQWRRGNVFLAGDAAHQMPPFAGQGMCSGVRDAANLAWRLDLALRGQIGESALDAYAVERMENVRAVVDFSISLGQVICVPDVAEAAARDEALAAGVVDGQVMEVPPLPGIATGVRDDSPHAGAAFLQGFAAGVDGRRVRVDEAVGAGWRLLTIDPAPIELPGDLAAWFSDLGGRVVGIGTAGPGGQVGGDGCIVDVDETYAKWFADHGVTSVLQRPDFHLFGTATDGAGAVSLVGALQTALHR